MDQKLYVTVKLINAQSMRGFLPLEKSCWVFEFWTGGSGAGLIEQDRFKQKNTMIAVAGICIHKHCTHFFVPTDAWKEWQIFSRELRGRFTELFPRNWLIVSSLL